MNPAKAIANSIIQRAMKMKTFKIVRMRPDGFEFNGPVPFDISINKEDVMTFTVHCMTLNEANRLVDDYLEKNSV
jgi:hypothetical protein